jgi:hypothetical protein
MVSPVTGSRWSFSVSVHGGWRMIAPQSTSWRRTLSMRRRTSSFSFFFPPPVLMPATSIATETSGSGIRFSRIRVSMLEIAHPTTRSSLRRTGVIPSRPRLRRNSLMSVIISIGATTSTPGSVPLRSDTFSPLPSLWSTTPESPSSSVPHRRSGRSTAGPHPGCPVAFAAPSKPTACPSSLP